jgi:probable HAF family extracellular repeat protein
MKINLMLSTASPAIIFAANLAIAGFTTPVLAKIESTYLLDLNTMQGTLLGTGYTIGRGINDAGQVVGVSGSHAFITGPNGVGMTDLGTLGGRYSDAYAVNDLGQVTGQSDTNRGVGRAFITGPQGEGMVEVGSPGDSSQYSIATGINNAGQAAGSFYTIGPWGPAFITGPNGMGITYLHAPSISLPSISLNGINDVGAVVGRSGHTAFFTGPDGKGFTDLGTLGGYGSTAMAINDAGQVVGSSQVPGGTQHAFIAGPDGLGMTDLGGTTAYGINDAGQVVGSAGTHAFITGPDGKGFRDLNTMFRLPEGSAWATAINNHGQIVVNVTTNVPPPTSIVPEPETYAMLLAGLGLVGFIAGRRKQAS